MQRGSEQTLRSLLCSRDAEEVSIRFVARRFDDMQSRFAVSTPPPTAVATSVHLWKYRELRCEQIGEVSATAGDALSIENETATLGREGHLRDAVCPACRAFWLSTTEAGATLGLTRPLPVIVLPLRRFVLPSAFGGSFSVLIASISDSRAALVFRFVGVYIVADDNQNSSTAPVCAARF